MEIRLFLDLEITEFSTSSLILSFDYSSVFHLLKIMLRRFAFIYCNVKIFFSFATYEANEYGHSPHFQDRDKKYRSTNSVLKKTWNKMKKNYILLKTLNFEIFGNTAIHRTKRAIRHMWRVANGLDNADLNLFLNYNILLPPCVHINSFLNSDLPNLSNANYPLCKEFVIQIQI